MDKHSGFVVFGRYIPQKFQLQPNINVKNSSIDISNEQFFKKFKGLEGDVWLNSYEEDIPTEDGILATVEEYNKVVNYYKEKRKGRFCDLLYICDVDSHDIPLAVQQSFSFCGYEVGIYRTMYNYWSCIANEVINGSLIGMKEFSRFLNNNFLFNEMGHAAKLLGTRNQLKSLGHGDYELEDIESMTNGESCQVLKIFSYAEDL